MAISLQADSTLPQGYILVDGQRVASVSTTGGLSATLAANTVTTSSLVDGSVTPQKLSGSIVSNLPAGSVIQTLQVVSSAVLTVNTAIDQTVTPVITSGQLMLSAAFTPTLTSNKVLIRYNAWANTTGGLANAAPAVVIFRDTIPTQTVPYYEFQNGGNARMLMTGEILDSPNTTNSIIYSTRVGLAPSNLPNTIYVNGNASGGQMYGGTCFTTLTIQEIKG